jgi:N-acetyl-anhydromuramyl-L-alanine amidase AmpD
MVIITEDPGRAEDTLERMTTIGARVSTHYYITLEGSIYQLVDEQYASWHSGMTTLSGVWFNLNRISIGVMIEGLPDDEEKNEEHPESQVDALRWLLRDVVERHNLGPNDVVLSGALATSKEIMPVRLMLEDVFA